MSHEEVQTTASQALAAIEERVSELERREEVLRLAEVRAAETAASAGGDRIRLNVGMLQPFMLE